MGDSNVVVDRSDEVYEAIVAVIENAATEFGLSVFNFSTNRMHILANRIVNAVPPGYFRHPCCNTPEPCACMGYCRMWSKLTDLSPWAVDNLFGLLKTDDSKGSPNDEVCELP